MELKNTNMREKYKEEVIRQLVKEERERYSQKEVGMVKNVVNVGTSRLIEQMKMKRQVIG